MDINNLTDVYNQNPTLQSQYTLQQYLDLFGGSSTGSTGTQTQTQTTTPTSNASQGIIGADINTYQGGGGGINNVVDTTSISQYRNPGIKEYGPGGKLEINPAAVGMSFYDSQPGGKKDQGFMERFMGAAVPSKQFSEFRSPGTGDVLKGPAEQGFMSQNIEGIPGNLTREDLRSMYDNYNKFTGRNSNYAMARVPGSVDNLINMVPYIGTVKRGAEAVFGPQGDKGYQSRYTVDNAGYGSTGARDEFGLATFDKKDGFLGLTGDVTRDYSNRMADKVNDIAGFFAERGIDVNDENVDIEKMKTINGFYTKQYFAYKNRLATDKINKEAARKAEEKRQAEIKEAQDRINRSETNINKATERGQAINKNEGVGSVNPTSAYGKSQGYTGGSHNPHTQSGWSGSSKKKAKGGLIRSYFDGGLVSLRRR